MSASAGAVAATRSTASSASLADQPRPTQGLVDLVAPRPRAPGPADGGAERRRRTGRAEPVLELEDDPLGALAADAGHLA